jgi:multidrug efflux system outer membrane protein
VTAGQGVSCLLLATLLAGCVAGPTYKKPEVGASLPAEWKTDYGPWRVSVPRDADPKGAWWKRYGDPQLDALEDKALADSTTLAIAAARLAQARATLNVASAGLLPQVGLGSRVGRSRISANRPLTNYNSPNFSTIQNDYQLSLTASYEVDLAGRIQRTIEGAQATAEQSAADLENVRMLLTADLASAYINLRASDIELDVVMRSIALQRRALDLVTSRHDLGAASGLEVTQQQALLDTTLVQVDVLRKQRSQFEHAIATLIGVPAPAFGIAPAVQAMNAPAVPLGVPSDILERRPDIASAERAVAAANAQIGVISAGYFPSVTLAPSYGYDSRQWSSLFDVPSLVWSVGLAASQTLFDGGRLRNNVAAATANRDAAAASYRRVVLIAMQETEDGITGLAALESATTQAQTAVQTARQALDMATARYEGGATTYLDVITAQQSALTAERQAAQLSGQRLLTSVALVKALGGDWKTQ